MTTKWLLSLALAVGLLAVPAVVAGWWQWDEEPRATHYRLYWTSNLTAWSACDLGEEDYNEAGDYAPNPLPGQVIYIMVTAVNRDGEEGPGEHGPIYACTTHDTGSSDSTPDNNPHYQRSGE